MFWFSLQVSLAKGSARLQDLITHFQKTNPKEQIKLNSSSNSDDSSSEEEDAPKPKAAVANGVAKAVKPGKKDSSSEDESSEEEAPPAKVSCVSFNLIEKCRYYVTAHVQYTIATFFVIIVVLDAISCFLHE